MPSPTVWDTMYRTEFARALQAGYPAEIANVMRAGQVLNSTKAKERQTWMTPVPSPTEFKGTRNFGLLSYLDAEVTNKVYTAEFMMQNDDMDDEQMGLWKAKPGELVSRCQRKIPKLMLAKAAAAESTENFEGTSGQYHAASSHTIGTGDNLIATTCDAGSAHDIIALYIGGGVKPLLWYDRAGPKIDSDAGTKEASKSRQTKWWCDLRGVAAYGYWWDFVFNALTGTPTVAEFKTAIGEITEAYRSFQTPDSEYVHEQTIFGSGNLLVIVPPEVESVARQVKENQTISLTSNEWVNSFDYIVSNDLD